jgi:hypothetical protein
MRGAPRAITSSTKAMMRSEFLVMGYTRDSPSQPVSRLSPDQFPIRMLGGPSICIQHSCVSVFSHDPPMCRRADKGRQVLWRSPYGDGHLSTSAPEDSEPKSDGPVCFGPATAQRHPLPSDARDVPGSADQIVIHTHVDLTVASLVTAFLPNSSQPIDRHQMSFKSRALACRS